MEWHRPKTNMGYTDHVDMAMRHSVKMLRILGCLIMWWSFIAPMDNAIAPSQAAEHETVELSSQTILQLLTEEERAWISELGALRVAGPKAFPPFHYYDEDGDARGMASDYIGLILGLLGVTFEVKPNLPWPDVLKGVKAHHIDLIACAAKTAERERYLIFSKPYISFPMVIIARTDAPFIGGLEDLHGKKVAFIRKVATYEWIVRDKVNAEPIFVTTPIEALEAVSLGRAQAHIANLAAATYLIQKNGLANLKVAAPTAYGNYNLSIAVRGDWPELAAIVNKVLSGIPHQLHSTIRNRWVSVPYQAGVGKGDILKWITLVGGISVLLIAGVLLWNRRLSREITERKKIEQSLAESELRFRALFEQAAVGVAQIKSSTGRFVRINQRYCDIVGYPAEEMTSKNFMQITHPDDLQADMENMRNLLAGEIQEFVTEKRYCRPDGSIVWVNLTVSPMWKPEEAPDFHIAVVEDISDKKKSEEALMESRRQLTTLIDNLPGMAYRCRNESDWKMEFVSDGSVALTGYQPEAIIDSATIAYADIIHPEDRQKVWQGVQAAISHHEPFELIYRIETAAGQLKWVWEMGRAVLDDQGQTAALEGFITDITERTMAEEHIKASLEEKEVLLKEVHHRVKNNMQIIQSLLNLQAGKFNTPELKQPMIDSINRIRSMALIHETLYRSKDMANLNIETYFKKVAEHLMQIYQRPDYRVALTIVVDPISMDMDRCIACGLIINELVSNAMKYAFTTGSTAQLLISLEKQTSNEAVLRVRDNGRGLPDTIDIEDEATLGLKIVRVLAEGQLNGTLEVGDDDGAVFSVTFPLDH